MTIRECFIAYSIAMTAIDDDISDQEANVVLSVLTQNGFNKDEIQMVMSKPGGYTEGEIDSAFNSMDLKMKKQLLGVLMRIASVDGINDLEHELILEVQEKIKIEENRKLRL